MDLRAFFVHVLPRTTFCYAPELATSSAPNAEGNLTRSKAVDNVVPIAEGDLTQPSSDQDPDIDKSQKFVDKAF